MFQRLTTDAVDALQGFVGWGFKGAVTAFDPKRTCAFVTAASVLTHLTRQTILDEIATRN